MKIAEQVVQLISAAGYEEKAAFMCIKSSRQGTTQTVRGPRKQDGLAFQIHLFSGTP
jgi:hypothetical protein